MNCAHSSISIVTTVVAITESWLSPDIPNSAIDVEDYAVVRRDRKGHGGGILCYIRENVCTTDMDLTGLDKDSTCDVSTSEILCAFIEKILTILIVIYHPFWDNEDSHAKCSFTIIWHYRLSPTQIWRLPTGDYLWGFQWTSQDFQ